MATAVLTDRQQEIKALMEQGKKAPSIAKDLKISENAVYQHQRKIRAALGGKATAPKSGAKSGRKSGGKSAPKAKPAAAAAPKPAPTPAPVKPPTMLQLAKAEVKEAADNIKAEEAKITAAEREIVAARERIQRLSSERDRRSDVLAVLQGEKRAVAIPKPKDTPAEAPAAPKPAASRSRSTGAKGSGAKANGTNGGQSAPSAPQGAPSRPTTQAEREATAEHDGTGEAAAQDAAAEAPQVPAAA